MLWQAGPSATTTPPGLLALVTSDIPRQEWLRSLRCGQEAELPFLLGTWRGGCCWSQSIGGFVAPELGHVSPKQHRILGRWEAEKGIRPGVAPQRGGKASVSTLASALAWPSPSLCFNSPAEQLVLCGKDEARGQALS